MRVSYTTQRLTLNPHHTYEVSPSRNRATHPLEIAPLTLSKSRHSPSRNRATHPYEVAALTLTKSRHSPSQSCATHPHKVAPLTLTKSRHSPSRNRVPDTTQTLPYH